MRKFLYNGESIWIDTAYNGAKITAENIPIEYIAGGRIYKVSSGVDKIKIEYLEFTKNGKCSNRYCLRNTIEGVEEVVVQCTALSVRRPFKVRDKIKGNYLEVEIIPDKFLSQDAQKESIVFINGNRMEYKNGRYILKSSVFEERTPLSLCVFYKHIQYVHPCSVKYPKDFFYLLAVKKRDNKYFVRITLYQESEYLSLYKIDFMNPLVSSTGLVTQVPLRKEKDSSLGVVSESSSISIQSLEKISEVFLEVIPLKERDIHRFVAKINEYPILFKIKAPVPQ